MNLQQIQYLLSAAVGRLVPSRLSCPQCGCAKKRHVSRKKLVTSLVECSQCRLRFRIPQDPPRHYFDFYQKAYSSSLATECPSADQLQSMLQNNFAGTGKNFARRIEIVQALGVASGAAVLDYGASWGYATWQFREAGYDASGFEISRPRAAYAREQLNVDVADDPDTLPDKAFDCMFCCHVLEHVPAPRIAFDLATRVLKPGGLFVAFTPNGSEASHLRHPEDYDHSWGRLHPLYLNSEFYQQCLSDRHILLASANYGSSYPLDEIRGWDRQSNLELDVSGRELLLAAVF